MKLEADTPVWYCENGEYATLDYGGYVPCGAVCRLTTFANIPEYLQRDLIEDEKEDTK